MLSLYRFILIILFIPCVLIFANTLIPGYGHTLYFDGSDDKVVVPYSEELNNQQYSVMFWIKPKLDESTTNPNGTGILSLKGKYGKKRGYYFIITDDKKAADYFLKNIKSSIGIHNSSTQFADGGEFGFGAEVGISTNNLPPRGPVGLKQLVSYKYEIYGKGQIRK